MNHVSSTHVHESFVRFVSVDFLFLFFFFLSFSFVFWVLFFLTESPSPQRVGEWVQGREARGKAKTFVR